MSPKQGSGSPRWTRRASVPDEAPIGVEWAPALDGGSRIYPELVRVACPPSGAGWVARCLSGRPDPGEGLEHPVHGWLRRADHPVRSIHRSDRTLCGLRLEELRWRDLDHLRWDDVQAALRCRICAVVLEQ